MVTHSAKANELAIDGASFDAFERAGWERVACAYHDFAGGITPRIVEPLLDAAGVLAEVDEGYIALDSRSAPSRFLERCRELRYWDRAKVPAPA